MKLPFTGAIDCDLHPAVPAMAALMPYLGGFWREHLAERYIDHSPFTLGSYAPGPAAIRAAGLAAGHRIARALISTHYAPRRSMRSARLCHRQSAERRSRVFNADMGAAIFKAVNDWAARGWLDREPRLRTSIVVPPQDAYLAAAEIERRARDQRFVQVLRPVTCERCSAAATIRRFTRRGTAWAADMGARRRHFRYAPTGPAGRPSS